MVVEDAGDLDLMLGNRKLSVVEDLDKSKEPCLPWEADVEHEHPVKQSVGHKGENDKGL